MSQGTGARRPRGGGRLGRGLGALIPDAEPPVEPARPLDVLLPDKTGSGTRRDRGGSAKDLLGPRKAPVVSRETSRPSSESRAGETPERGRTAPTPLAQVPDTTFGLIDTELIVPNLKQPRQVFDPEELAELSESVRQVGLLQPVVIRRITQAVLEEDAQKDRLATILRDQPDAKYELVMGERRWRAAQLAGMEKIPAIVRSTDSDDLLRDALLENLHRVALNPLEEAAAYSQLMEDFSCTQEELSRRIARSRPQIANTLRLLKLPPAVQRQVAAGTLSAGHARALLGLESASDMEKLAAKVHAEGLSVRSTEELVKLWKGTQPARRRPQPQTTARGQEVARELGDRLDTRVTITEGAKKGRLVIEFAGPSDLERIAEILRLEA